MDVDDQTIDHIKGAIYGHALGDAVGINSEFKFKRDKPCVDFPYTIAIKDFEPCDWTDDTDQLCLALRCFSNSDIDPIVMANSLHTWMKEGFAELGDESGYMNGALSCIVSNPNFLTNPILTADEFWRSSGGLWATNGSINRTTAVGLCRDNVSHNATTLCSITHADPRAIAACILHSTLIHNLCYAGSKEMQTSSNVDELLSVCIEQARIALLDNTQSVNPHDDELSNWIRIAYTGAIDDLHLDNNKIDYVFKTLSCSIYALQVIKRSIELNRKPSFEKIITKFAKECGNANTNCAIVGSIMGAYVGYSKLPKEWLEVLPHKQWLDNIVDEFITKNVKYQQ